MLILGGVALGTGLGVASSDDQNIQTAGLVTAGAGVVLAVIGGIIYYDASRAKKQQGATTVWKP